MKISDLQNLLSKAQGVVGDAEIVLKHAEDESETVVHGLGLALSAAEGELAGKVAVVHGDAPPAPEPEPAAETDAGGSTGDTVVNSADGDASAASAESGKAEGQA